VKRNYGTKQVSRASRLLEFRVWLANCTDAMLQAPGMVETWSRDTRQTVQDVRGAIECEVVRRARQA
jgi:hypothetical protein